MKLLIAVPCYETMRVEFARSLMDLVSWLHEHQVTFEVKILSGTLVYGARDKLAKHAVNNQFDEVLFIDSDMVFDRHLYEDLKMAGKDMTCGLFVSRHYPYVSCLFSSLKPVERINETPDEAFEVEACGFGAVLLKTEILKQVMFNNGGSCFIPEKDLGEDVAFCKRVRDLGVSIWCEPTARVGHVGAVTIWPEDVDRLRGDIQELNGKKIE